MARRKLTDRRRKVLPIIAVVSCSVLGLVWAPASAASQKEPRMASGHWLVRPTVGAHADGRARFYVNLKEPLAEMTALTTSTKRERTSVAAASRAPTGPRTSEHYAVNGNFSGSTYEPGGDGFNLADVSSNGQAAALPAGVKGLVWIGSCAGATSAFRSRIRSYVGDPKVFGFYLMDEPDPSSCPAAHLKTESDWIHAHDPGKYTFIVEQDLSSSNHPTYAGGYDRANSHVDLYGLDPYPCRSDNPASAPCAYSWIRLAVTAAKHAGIPLADIVPVYQAFGGGTWVDDGGGSYRLPTATQESIILSTWASLVPTPVFDYAYSWGTQKGDKSLKSSSALRQVFAAYIKKGGHDTPNLSSEGKGATKGAIRSLGDPGEGLLAPASQRRLAHWRFHCLVRNPKGSDTVIPGRYRCVLSGTHLWTRGGL